MDSNDPSNRGSVGYQHPVTWSEQDLFAILSRLFLEQRVGLMDDPKPVREIFTPEELQHILPGVIQAFHTATAEEWVAFGVVRKSGTDDRAVTSGGLFLQEGRLHIVVANHRTMLPADSPELLKVRQNPLYSVHGPGGALGMEPRRFVMSTKANWSGGYRASANEMVLDHGGFLASLRFSERRAVTEDLSPAGEDGRTRKSTRNAEPIAEGLSVDTTATIHRLEGEIEQLKRQLADKQLQVERLKSHAVGQPSNR